MKVKGGQLIAVQNKIILRQAEAESKVGNIVLADVSKKKRYCGKVLAVGPGKAIAGELEAVQEFAADIGGSVTMYHPRVILKPLDVQVGDFIHFMDYHGGEITVDGETLLVIDEDDVLGVVRKGA